MAWMPHYAHSLLDDWWGYRPPKRTVVVLGASGQDGSYMLEFLLKRGHCVHGVVRRHPEEKFARIDHLKESDVTLHHANLFDRRSIERVLEEAQPDYVFNFAGESSVALSYRRPEYTFAVNGEAVRNVLNAIRNVNPGIRLFQASSSEVFGETTRKPHTPETPHDPKSPMGVARSHAHRLVDEYRNEHDLHVSIGIFYPHTSPRQTLHFPIRRITLETAKIRLGDVHEFRWNNMVQRLDYGFAGDYVEAAWKCLTRDRPADHVIGTGRVHTVREILKITFDYVGCDWEKYVRYEAGSPPPTDVNGMMPDIAFTLARLPWRPSITFEELLYAMICSEFFRMEILQHKPSRYLPSTTAETIRGPRPNWPLGDKLVVRSR
jgi:GDPmannose 4,6-dehydratase